VEALLHKVWDTGRQNQKVGIGEIGCGNCGSACASQLRTSQISSGKKVSQRCTLAPGQPKTRPMKLPHAEAGRECIASAAMVEGIVSTEWTRSERRTKHMQQVMDGGWWMEESGRGVILCTCSEAVKP
jgi:hypothetical protein